MRTGKIGFVIPDITDDFYFRIVRGVEQNLKPHHYSLIVSSTSADGEYEAAAIKMLLENGVDGLILMTFRLESRELKEIPWNGLPLVFIGGQMPNLPADTVEVAQEDGAYLAARHLIELGHRDVGIILGSLDSYDSELRLRGYGRALQDSGLPFNPNWAVRGEFTREGGCKAAYEMLSRYPRPSAILACNDWMALGTMNAAGELGITVPQDLSIVGFDDIAPARRSYTPLTTVRQPALEVGQKAARAVLNRIRSPLRPFSHIVLETELMIRKTTAPFWAAPLENTR